MARTSVLAITAVVFGLSGCSGGGIKYTLYRTGTFDHSMRVQWATFDTNETAYNAGNCGMAERLLNANFQAKNGPQLPGGFGWWCEAGPFREQGQVPNHFVAEYPTDA